MKCPQCSRNLSYGDNNATTPVKGFDTFWVSVVKRYAKPEDSGVGDTVQRLAAKLGGEVFKWFAIKIGIPCGCSGRQAQWNEKYPYQDNQPDHASQ